MHRKLSDIPATNLTDNIQGGDKPLKIRVGKSWVLSNSLKALDALSDDRISNSPCLPGRNNSLLHDICSACNKTPLGEECIVCGKLQEATPSPQAVSMYTEASVRNTLAGKPHPLVNYREWLESVCSDDNVIPPTARQVNNGEFWCHDCDRSVRVCPHYRTDTVRLTTEQFTRTTHDIGRSGNARKC
jgi:hypothetical protein